MLATIGNYYYYYWEYCVVSYTVLLLLLLLLSLLCDRVQKPLKLKEYAWESDPWRLWNSVNERVVSAAVASFAVRIRLQIKWEKNHNEEEDNSEGLGSFQWSKNIHWLISRSRFISLLLIDLQYSVCLLPKINISVNRKHKFE